MIFKFLDASTADGHNPYRVTRDGFEWEVQDPHDPWSYIGYWGDHQVIYLLKLLELSARFHPGALQALLGRRLFTYADVPYRIRPFDGLVADPQRTIDFDDQAHRAGAGTRGRSWGPRASCCWTPPVTRSGSALVEKLLVLVLARLANFVPEAGLWMNTQRPEWNDANNALVGNGASVVTLAYLRRFLAFARDLLGTTRTPFEVSSELALALERMSWALRAHAPVPGSPIDESPAAGGAGGAGASLERIPPEAVPATARQGQRCPSPATLWTACSTRPCDTSTTPCGPTAGPTACTTPTT